MTDFKITVSDSAGRSMTKELRDDEGNALLGRTIGSSVDASMAGFSGTMRITGGSDRSGVPMRQDVHGSARKYVLLSRGVGLRESERGKRVRKLVRGNQVSEEIYQVNCRLDGQLPAEQGSGDGKSD